MAGHGQNVVAGLLVLLCLPVAGCAAGPCAAVGGTPGVVAELLFGLSMRDGGSVPAAAWQEFLADNITPRFPLGLTVLDGQGQWTARNGERLREPSKLVLIATTSGAATLERLQAIRAEYRARFAQDSVGLLLQPSCNAF